MNDPDTETQVVDHDYRQARITATLKMSETDKLNPYITSIEDKLNELFSGQAEGAEAPMSARATGMSKLISNMDRHLLQSATRSVGLAFITVLLFMTLALRSVRLGLFSMIPNLSPSCSSWGSWAGRALGWIRGPP